MRVVFCDSAKELGEKAAGLAAERLREAIRERGEARLILSTGASQFTTLEALVKQDVDFGKVEMFHLDEYVDLPQTHPASFVRYLQERFVNKVGRLKAVHYVDPSDGVKRLIEKLTAQLDRAPVDVGLIGIGENAHIAFNDPPADFQSQEAYRVVLLDEACRRQQLREGWFQDMEEVPRYAVSMTVNRILKCSHIISAVPYEVKAEAVYRTVTSGVTNLVPATALKLHPDAVVFVDRQSGEKIREMAKGEQEIDLV